MFLALQRAAGQTPYELVQDVDTRWNSTELIIGSFLKLKVK